MSRKNFDPNVVVMTREAYDELLRLADAGTRELGEYRFNKVCKKIRRFNQTLMDEFKIYFKKEKSEDKCIRDNVRHLLRYTGKTVYVVKDRNIYIPIQILAKATYNHGDKKVTMLGYLRCRILSKGDYRPEATYYYKSIVTELPENHAPILDGELKGCFVFPDGFKELNQSQWLRK